MSKQTNRRDFLKTSAATGVGFWISNSTAPARDAKSANDTVNIACIGVGGKGSSDTDQAGNHGNIVALCDIDDNNLNAKGQKFPKAKKYNDFRKMLDEMHKEIDAVVVSTPDHTHAPASVMAMRLGKHVYCQKPLAHTVYEARLMRDLAREKNLSTQMGNQGTAEAGLRTAVEIVQAGSIGDVKEVHVWTNRPVWPQSPDIKSRPSPKDAPKHVHFDLFLGPMAERPYAEYTPEQNRKNKTMGAYHPFNWRGWWDFGTGALGDMACHTANMAFMALKLGQPVAVSAECEELNPETYPGWARVTYEFPARGNLPPVKLFWYEGRRDGQLMLPPTDLTKGLKLPTSGSLLVGSKGMLYSPNDYGAAFKLLPEMDFADFKAPEPKLPRHAKGSNIDDNMKKEWIAAIKGGPKPMSNFDYAATLTEAMLLGNVAMRAGKKIAYDGKTMKIPNAPEAEALLKLQYRKGWTL